jgi:hypothetical protein
MPRTDDGVEKDLQFTAAIVAVHASAPGTSTPIDMPGLGPEVR